MRDELVNENRGFVISGEERDHHEGPKNTKGDTKRDQWVG